MRLNFFAGQDLGVPMESVCDQSARSRPQSPPVRSPASATIRRVASYIEENYADSLPLSELARLAEISPFTLVNVFRREVGIPPRQYICYVRVREAKALLRSGVSLASAATDAGFFDQSHLTRHFKRFCGMTPGQYLAQMTPRRPARAAVEDARASLW
jgi:AraC-like DNA-binding protein